MFLDTGREPFYSKESLGIKSRMSATLWNEKYCGKNIQRINNMIFLYLSKKDVKEPVKVDARQAESVFFYQE
jgi:hypothetical protein